MQGRPPHCSVFTVIRSINSGMLSKIGLSAEDFKRLKRLSSASSCASFHPALLPPENWNRQWIGARIELISNGPHSGHHIVPAARVCSQRLFGFIDTPDRFAPNHFIDAEKE
jgi:hypothetical protein